MKVLPFSDITAADWDGFCSRSPQAWIFHKAGWIALEAHYSKSENRSFGLVSGDRLVAVMPLLISRLSFGSFVELLVHNGLHRHTGLAFAPDLDATELAAAQRVSVNTILQVAASLDADRIYLAQQNLAPESLSAAREEIPFWIIDHGFQLGNSFGPLGLAPAPGLASTVVDQIVSLARPDDELFGALTKSCRYTVRKAMEEDFHTENLAANESCIDDYYQLALLSAQRTGEAIPDRDYYSTVRDMLLPSGSCSFLFASLNGQKVAAAILLHDKGATYYFSGVSDPSFLAQGVNDLLQWKMLLFAKDRGDQHYRLGPYFPGLPREWPVSKVSRFKSKFGARPWTIVQGSKFLKPERYVKLAQEHVAHLCSEMIQ
jgi:Acetyltransferase (GNAT) domain